MYGTKIEINLPKAEPGHWSNLDFPRAAPAKVEPTNETNSKPETPVAAPPTSGDESDVDLEEIEPLRACKISEA